MDKWVAFITYLTKHNSKDIKVIHLDDKYLNDGYYDYLQAIITSMNGDDIYVVILRY